LATASPHVEQHAADRRSTSLQLFGQPDRQTAVVHPAAFCLQLQLLLRDWGFGITSVPLEACAAAFLSSEARISTAVSAAAACPPL
jgi:hypothetical protein